jgi:hypothetical protein
VLSVLLDIRILITPLVSSNPSYNSQRKFLVDHPGNSGYYMISKACYFFRSAEYIKSNLVSLVSNKNSNMTSFKRFESKPVVKIIYIYTHCNLWRHRQFITLFYQFLHIRIEIIHGSHMYILFLPRVGLYVSFLSLACARGKTSWYKGLPVVKTIYTHGFHELFLKQTCHSIANQME